MTINVDCALRPCEAIQLPASATGRDLYLQVSASTNLSRKLFKLLFRSTLIEDTFNQLSQYGIVSGVNVSLLPNITAGQMSSNFAKLDPARQAIRKYAFSLSVATVQRFFSAEEELKVRIPVAGQWGTLKFKLDNPMPEESLTLPETADRYSDVSMLHSVKQPNDRTYSGKFSGSLKPDSLDSRGVPSRTVDTIVNILENLLDTCGL